MKKQLLMLLTAIALLMMTACGTADTDKKVNGSDEGNGSSEAVKDNEDEGVEDTDTDADKEEEVEKEQATETDVEKIREEAAFVGMIDNNSIEVNTEFETIVLRTSEVKNVDFGAIEENAHVIIEYYKNKEGQNILTDIEVK